MNKFIFLFLLFVLLPNISTATKMCHEISKREFEKRVLDKSDLIALVEILDYSNSSIAEKQWTDVKILKVLYSKNPTEIEQIRLDTWQAWDPPVYVDNKGYKAIFFLNKIANTEKFYFTDNDWMACGPSNWPLYNGHTYNGYKIVADKVKNTEITVEELAHAIQEYYK